MPPGGGGLVILPKKSWNVWNDDNKAKVARDEKAHSQLIEAQQKCKKQILAQIRFDRLNGIEISEQEQQRRVQHALDTMNIADYIEDPSMLEIAHDINHRLEKEKNASSTAEAPDKRQQQHRKLKRRLCDLDDAQGNGKGKSEAEDAKYAPRRKHKRCDVSIIDDHYSKRNNFEFDPMQYKNKNNKKQSKQNKQTSESQSQSHHDSSHDSQQHFSLFNERDLKTGYRHPDVASEKQRQQQMEDAPYKLSQRRQKPWYLVTHQPQHPMHHRQMLMKSDEVQQSLPRNLRDYHRTTQQLTHKSEQQKTMQDPMHAMKMKSSSAPDVDGACDHQNEKVDSKPSKRSLKKQKKKLIKALKRRNKEMKKKLRRSHAHD